MKFAKKMGAGRCRWQKFFNKPISVGEGRMLFSLPAGTTDIHWSKLN